MHLIGRDQLMIMSPNKTGDNPFARILHFDRQGSFATNSSDNTGALDLSILGTLLIQIPKALFGTHKLSLNNSSITPGTAGRADTGAKANTPSVGIVEGLGSLFRLEFHALIRFKIRKVTLRKVNSSSRSGSRIVRSGKMMGRSGRQIVVNIDVNSIIIIIIISSTS
jgi:hypothetical protein